MEMPQNFKHEIKHEGRKVLGKHLANVACLKQAVENDE